MGKVFAVGVGPGASDHLTEDVKKIILGSDVVLGYKYTLNTISNLIQDKQVHEITMENQEEVYQKISKELGGRVFRLRETLIFLNLKLWID
jgi:precorrin-3B methylase